MKVKPANATNEAVTAAEPSVKRRSPRSRGDPIIGVGVRISPTIRAASRVSEMTSPVTVSAENQPWFGALITLYTRIPTPRIDEREAVPVTRPRMIALLFASASADRPRRRPSLLGSSSMVLAARLGEDGGDTFGEDETGGFVFIGGVAGLVWGRVEAEGAQPMCCHRRVGRAARSPPSLDDWLPADHTARFVSEIVVIRWISPRSTGRTRMRRGRRRSIRG